VCVCSVCEYGSWSVCCESCLYSASTRDTAWVDIDMASTTREHVQIAFQPELELRWGPDDLASVGVAFTAI
jgi:hypothetical protein